MGNCNFKSSSDDSVITTIARNSFTFLYAVGRGGFGKVWKVQYKKTGAIYAMKELSKARILAKKSVPCVLNERNLLTTLNNPFLVNCIFAFQDRDHLYLVTDIMPGGDLRFHMCKQGTFNEEQTKFFAACMIEGLDYMHTNGVLHRDMKPENLVFDDKGYLRLTDLGVARIMKPDNANDTSGTPGYMSPEVMCRQNHGVATDYYAVGVIVHELMLGTRPYPGKQRKEIKEAIVAKQVQLAKEDLPAGWSLEAGDFINKLIQRKPEQRLGRNGPEELKNHPWFKGFNWEALGKKELPAAYKPSRKNDNFDLKYANVSDPWKDEQTSDLHQNTLLLRDEAIQALFDGYYYDHRFMAADPTLAYSQIKSVNIALKSDMAGNDMGDINNILVNSKPISQTGSQPATRRASEMVKRTDIEDLMAELTKEKAKEDEQLPSDVIRKSKHMKNKSEAVSAVTDMVQLNESPVSNKESDVQVSPETVKPTSVNELGHEHEKTRAAVEDGREPRFSIMTLDVPSPARV